MVFKLIFPFLYKSKHDPGKALAVKILEMRDVCPEERGTLKFRFDPRITITEVPKNPNN